MGGRVGGLRPRISSCALAGAAWGQAFEVGANASRSCSASAAMTLRGVLTRNKFAPVQHGSRLHTVRRHDPCAPNTTDFLRFRQFVRNARFLSFLAPPLHTLKAGLVT